MCRARLIRVAFGWKDMLGWSHSIPVLPVFGWGATGADSFQTREYSIRFGAQPSHQNDRTQPSHFEAVVFRLLCCTHQQQRALLARTDGIALCLLVRSGMAIEMLSTRSKQVIKSSKRCKIHVLFIEQEQGAKSTSLRELWTAHSCCFSSRPSASTGQRGKIHQAPP